MHPSVCLSAIQTPNISIECCGCKLQTLSKCYNASLERDHDELAACLQLNNPCTLGMHRENKMQSQYIIVSFIYIIKNGKKKSEIIPALYMMIRSSIVNLVFPLVVVVSVCDLSMYLLL